MIDLRSDTLTRPTPAMLDYMMGAEVGDDVYGEDPTVNRLETVVAELLGKESAVFVPSGTMANQIAIHLHTSPGDSAIAEEGSHCYSYEAGAAAAMSGVQFDLLPWSAGYSDEAIRQRFRGASLHASETRLLIVENSHNRAGGRALALNEMQRLASTGHALGLAVHCDGARLWNAAVATGSSEKALVEGYDSVAVCFSKGLGAPVGSALAGSRSMIHKARKLRKRWGGGMRQAGYLAAAALYGIDNNRQRLAEDHQNAAILQDCLLELRGKGDVTSVLEPRIPTNMTYFKVSNAEVVLAKLKAQGIFANHMGHNWIRFVCHLDVTGTVANACEVLRRTLSA